MADTCRLPFGQQLQAGDAWRWKETLPDYPPSDFTLKYFFRGNAAGASLDIVAETDPDNQAGFLLTASGSATGALPAGSYSWQKCVFAGGSPSGSGDRTTLDHGALEVLANLAGKTAPYDGRTHNKRVYDAICAMIEGRATRIESQYMVAGRELHLLAPRELEEWKGIYFNRVKREGLESGEVAPDANLIRGVTSSIDHGPGVWNK